MVSMVEAAEATKPPTEVEATPIQFPEQPRLEPCTFLECPKGHRWAPQLHLAKCGYGTPTGWNGCGSPMLAIRMLNCPTCNEPTAKLRLRVDHTGTAPYPVPLCIPGSVAGHEVIVVEIQFGHAAQTEAIETARLAKDQK